MRVIALALVLTACGMLCGQQPGPPKVRSIVVNAVPTSPEGLPPMPLATIAAAWKTARVPLSLEARFEPASIEQAKAVIRELYAREGRAVRVEHTVSALPPRSVEVAFQIIELCQAR